MKISKLLMDIAYFIGVKIGYIPHCDDFSLPPGFPPGYCEHRKERHLTKGQVCEDSNCPYCRAYKEFISRH